jgi:hypothetical protein
MKKYLTLGILLLILAGCGNSTTEYANNKVLTDSSGCVFVARSGAGDTMFLRFIKELSKETCKFEVK